MNVLIIAMEDTRWGPARLPRQLREAGFTVAVLCPRSNPLAHTKFVDRRFVLPDTKFAGLMISILADAMEGFRPDLVIPADEQVVALLQSVLRDFRYRVASGLSTQSKAVLEFSLGGPAAYDALLFKNHTQKLARDIGVRTPDGEEAGSLEEALAAAERVGYPALVKKSFSWGGDGVRICADRAQLADAYARMTGDADGRLRGLARRALGRDWYPKPRHVWIQKLVPGEPAMYTLVAHAGQILAGFAGLPRTTANATGPSTVVDFGPHPDMAEASARMVRALGVTGFISFDFMIEHGTGKAYLLECNARPNQVSHLGARMGADFCAALLASLRAGAPAPDVAPLEATHAETITLFPQEWLHAPASPAIAAHFHDVPWGDEPLIARMTAEAVRRQPRKSPVRACLGALSAPWRVLKPVQTAAG